MKGEILESLKYFLEPGQVTELRALDVTTTRYKRPHVVSGYFNNIEKLASAASSITTARSIYFIPNPCDPALLSRAENRIRELSGKDSLTQDSNILRRKWFFVDIDPKRPSGISSTKEEHESAIEKAKEIRAYLSKKSFSTPLLASSGNGAHLIYAIDLAPESNLVQKFLEMLAFKFNDSCIDIDDQVANPARLFKIYGTFARKGDSTNERPHRKASILEVPKRIEATPEEVLVNFLSTIVLPKRSKTRDLPRQVNFDLEKWIYDCRLPVVGPAAWGTGRRWIFPVCPWNSSHTDRSAFLVQFPTGEIAAGCHHSSCSGENWHTLKEVIDPNWRETSTDYTSKDEGYDPDEEPRIFNVITLKDLFEQELPKPNFIIEKILPEGSTIFAGRPKTGKSWLTLNLCLSVTSGAKKCLGKFQTTQGDALYLGLEDNFNRLKSRMEMILANEPNGNTSLENFYLLTKINIMTEGGIDLLQEFTYAHPDLKLIVIDTLKRFNPNRLDARNDSYSEEYKLSAILHDFALDNHVSVIIVHHTSKMKYEYFLDEVSGTTGLTAGSDGVFVLRRSLYGNILHVTGKDIDEQEYAIRFDKTTGIWNIIGSPEENQITEQRRQILDALKEHGMMSSRQISSVTQIDYNLIRTTVARLVQSGLVIHDKATKRYYVPDLDDEETENGIPPF